MEYQGKVVLLTGGSSDIGKEIITFFANAGAKVIVTYYQNEKKIKEYAIKCDSYYLDLSDENSIMQLYDYVKKKYGHVDILINNAAISLDNHILDKTKAEFMKVLEVNTVGTFLMMKYFDKLMTNGYIFNISSTDGIDTGNVYSIDYNVSKAGINCLTKTFSLYSSNKIISICPNWVDTLSTRRMDPNYLNSELERVGQKKLIHPKTIVNVIDKSMKNNIESGRIIRIDGGIDD